MPDNNPNIKTNEWVLDKNNLSYWLRQIRKEMELIAPIKERGDIVVKTVSNIHDIELDCPALIPSPKGFLFPQFEPILKNNKNGAIEDLRNNTKRALFGIRSCDVSAINILDRFYLAGFKEPYYEARRKNTLLISIVCNKPDPTCFCSHLGTGPYLKSGFDIQLYDLGNRYLAQAGSEEGVMWCEEFDFLMTPLEKTDHEDQYEIEVSSKVQFSTRVSLEQARQLILSGQITDEFWSRVTERCFECGGCVHECPLCTCFSVIDREHGGEMERVKLWDACLYKGFTRMAGGVLPAEVRIKRTKRWFYHKLIHYPDTLGAFGCVGCGRCAVTCPGRIDMATVVMRMKYE